MRDPIYLDYNATAPIRPEVRDAVIAAFGIAGNPRSMAWPACPPGGRDARAEVAACGITPARVVFTSGGTEANTAALRATGRTCVLVSSIEHDSVLETAPDALRVPVTPDGLIDLAALERLLVEVPEPALVSVMRVNNETGVIQPLTDVVRISHAHGALVHCDAYQAAGRHPLEVDALGIDLMTLSAHKLGGTAGRRRADRARRHPDHARASGRRAGAPAPGRHRERRRHRGVRRRGAAGARGAGCPSGAWRVARRYGAAAGPGGAGG